MDAVAHNEDAKDRGTPLFDAHYAMFEFSVWFASTFGVERLRFLAAQAKEEVRSYDERVDQAKKDIRCIARRTTTYRIASNPTVDDVVSLSTLLTESDDDLESLQISNDSPEDNVARGQYSKLLLEFLSKGKLSAREKEVFILRTGLLDSDQFTREEIGKIFGVSRQSILSIEQSAMRKCRKYLLQKGFSIEDLR